MLFLESYNFILKSFGYCVVKRGNPFSFVSKVCHQVQSLLRSQKLLAVHILQITKTCRFAARRARPAYFILVSLCVVLSVLLVLLPTTPLLYINKLSYLTIIILSLFSLLFSSVASRLVCQMLSDYCLINKTYCL